MQRVAYQACAGFVVAVVVVGGCLSSAAAALASGWSIRWVRGGAFAVGLVVAVGLLLAPLGFARGVVWSVQRASFDGVLLDVSCVSADACMGVGGVGYKGGPGAMSWDGRRWTALNVPSPPEGGMSDLRGVSCTSSTACMAVGTYTDTAGDSQPMAVAWNGASWSLLSAPGVAGSALGGSASGVSCVAESACMAVGGGLAADGSTLQWADWWDGSGWSRYSVPTPGRVAGLASVSCASSSACMAVGSYSMAGVEMPFAERWDGSGWTFAPMPSPAGMLGAAPARVSCPSPTACVAVGTSAAKTFSGALVERWDGVGWSLQPSAGEFPLAGVSCVSATACTAVGGDQPPPAQGPFAQRWDGSTWTLARLPGEGMLTGGVSCWSAELCTAVGGLSGNVLAYRSAPASAKLTGVPAACASGRFTVRVIGLGISSVTWRLGSRRIRGRIIARGQRYAALIRLSPGRNKLTVKVRFSAAGDAQARTFRQVLHGCPAGR